MPEETEYVFRGTTLGYKGNRCLIENEYTPTTRHPAIALLFAKECSLHFRESAVVYIAKLENVKHLEKSANVIKKYEQEFVVGVTPDEFVKHTEGYVTYIDLQTTLTDLGYDVSEIVRREKLTELCKKFRQIKAKELNEIMERLVSMIKTI